MEYEPIVVTKRRMGQAILLGCTGAVMVCVGVFVIYRGCIMAEYIQLPPVLAGLLCFLFGLLLVAVMLKSVSYRLYEDRLEVISLSGEIKKTIWLNTITSWTDTEVKGKRPYKMFRLFMGDDKYLISGRRVGDDYDVLKENLTKGKERVPWQVNKKANMRFTLVVVLISICFFAYSYNRYAIRTTELHAQDMTTIRGVILNPVAISHTGGRSRRSYIRIILNTYPDFIFSLDYASYYAARRNAYVQNVQRADSLFLDILTDDYEKKLAKEKPLGFFDKTVNYRDIEVYGLRDAHNTYLLPDDYNKAAKDDWSFVVPAIGGAIMLYMAFIVFTGAQRKRVE